MTLNSTENRVSFSGNDVTVDFAFPYRFLAEEDLVVILRDADDVETTLVLDTDYTVLGVDSPGAGGFLSGTVTLVVAPATGETLVIYRDPAQLQDLDLVENDPMPAEEVEERLDKQMMIAQRLSDRADRSFILKETDESAQLSLPLKDERASKFLAFDADGNPIAATTVDTVPVSSFMETLLDDTTAAQARGTLDAAQLTSSLTEKTAPVNADFAHIYDTAGTAEKKSALHHFLNIFSEEIFNLSLSAAVGSNALTMSLKTKAGSDPSSTDPVKGGFRNSTAGTGTFNQRSATGSLSLTISSGSTLGLVSAFPEYVYWYLIDNAGTLKLAAMGGANLIDEGSLVTTIAEGGGGGANTRYALYSDAIYTDVPIRLIGRTKHSLTTAGTWNEVPDEISLVPFSTPKTDARVILHTPSGHGAVNTAIRRYTTVQENTAAGIITYADSANDGGSLTILKDGRYAMQNSDLTSGATHITGISKNSSQLTTSVLSITAANRLAIGQNAAAQIADCFAVTRLKPGDIIRAHDDTSSDDASEYNVMRIEYLGD